MLLFVILLSTLQWLVNGDGSLTAGAFTAKWSLLSDQTSMVFNLSCTTSGWIGIGWSLSAPHTNMDTVVGWMSSSGTALIYDGFSSSKAQPSQDASQDFLSYSISSVSGVLRVNFVRKLSTCDVLEDVVISNQAMSLSYAYSAAIGVSGSNFPKHDSRGSTTTNLLSKCNAAPIVSNPDALLYDNCIAMDSTRNIRLRWSIRSSKIDMMIQGKVGAVNPAVSNSGFVAAGIRPSNFAGVVNLAIIFQGNLFRS